jgi:hypothetical protein
VPAPGITPKTPGFVMPDRRYRVLAVSAHPVQYMSPIFRRMAVHPRSISTLLIAAFAGPKLAMIPNLAPPSSGMFHFWMDIRGPRFPIVAPAGIPFLDCEIPAYGS